MVARVAKGTDLAIRPRPWLPFRRGPTAGPLRSLRRRQAIHPLMLAGLVAVAVVSALAMPALVGRKPVPGAASPVEAGAVAAPAPVRSAPVPQAPIVRAAAVAPEAPSPLPLPARTVPRPAPSVLSLDMLPVLAEPEAETPKTPARRSSTVQRRPDQPLRAAVP